MRDKNLSSMVSKEKSRYLLIVFAALLLLCLFQSSPAQSGRRPAKIASPPPQPASVETKPTTAIVKRTSEGDQIYNSRQVDVIAKITKGRNDRPSPRRGCPDNGKVIVRAVLHKSGRVIDITLVKGLNCSYDKDALEIVRKYKFNPAMKDGQPVSEAIEVEFQYRRII
jgi:periplasmic protein TonB